MGSPKVRAGLFAMPRLRWQTFAIWCCTHRPSTHCLLRGSGSALFCGRADSYKHTSRAAEQKQRQDHGNLTYEKYTVLLQLMILPGAVLLLGGVCLEAALLDLRWLLRPGCR